jgi:purine nucleoside phosphorylase
MVSRFRYQLVTSVASLSLSCARHNVNHNIPSHKGNYRANICALSKIGVKRIIATNAVGAINLDFRLGDFGSS